MPQHLGKPSRFSIMSIQRMRMTTTDEGHKHTYKPGDRMTSFVNEHSHLIIPGSKVTGPAGVNNHTHTIL